jgi:hypothetical protein
MSSRQDEDDQAAERYFRRRHGGGGAWAGAVVLIVVGTIFLLRNVGFPLPDNWWALFLAIPAIGSLAAAWRSYRRAGEVNGAVAGSLFAAVVLLALMALFLLDLNIDWNLFWPVILIALGLSMLLRSYRRW